MNKKGLALRIGVGVIAKDVTNNGNQKFAKQIPVER
jgi:hypothetical protein